VAQKRVDERPLNALRRKELATALEKKGRIDDAIAAWTEYTRLKPKDLTALRDLGQLELRQADRYLSEAQLASLAQQDAGVGSPFRPSSTDKFGQALGQDPISAALSSKASTALQEASVKYQTAASQAIATYQSITKVQPNEQAFFSLAQAAETLRQTPVAIGAYKRLLKFKLDPTTAAQIRQRIKILQQSSAPTGG
jgi:tetratricopeptide (TPR) repeat protein